MDRLQCDAMYIMSWTEYLARTKPIMKKIWEGRQCC
jgi:hypothetical protein